MTAAVWNIFKNRLKVLKVPVDFPRFCLRGDKHAEPSKCFCLFAAVSVRLQHNPHEDHGRLRAGEAAAGRDRKPVQKLRERQDGQTKDGLRNRGGKNGAIQF